MKVIKQLKMAFRCGDIILTTRSTGLSPRNVAPEAAFSIGARGKVSYYQFALGEPRAKGCVGRSFDIARIG